ncbi:MAG: dodecin family protein [Bacteroidota bacterium]
MSVAKVIEVIAEGNTVENAIKNAASEASKTLKNVRGVYAEGIQAIVEDGKVTSFRVNCKVTFVIS